jgi:hypothetical protein
MRAFRLHSCASRSVKARCAGRFPRLDGAGLDCSQRFAPMGGDGRRGGDELRQLAIAPGRMVIAA